MAQLTIYLDKRSEALIVKAAAKEKVSLSKWAREKLVEAAGAPEWPAGYASLLGGAPEFRVPEDPPQSIDPPAQL